MADITVSQEKSAWTTKEITFTAMFTALMAVCSWISVPTVVPFTFQTFAVYCTLECLGGKKGFFSILVYILLASAGIPVLAEFSGGLGVVLGTTGGYLIGFLVTAIVYGLFEKLPYHEKLWMRITVLILGTALLYVFGTIWFMAVYARQVEAVDLSTALAWCVTPFIIPDLIKIALAILITSRIKKHVRF